jgi:hypothetical protein
MAILVHTSTHSFAKNGFQPSKMQKTTVMARFSASLAYVFAARRTLGQYGPALRRGTRLSLQHYNQEDDEAR